MWDNPRLLNGIAAGLAAVALLLVGWSAFYTLSYSTLFPLRVLQVQGELAHVSRDQIEQALSGRVNGNFFSLDLAAVRDVLATLPWVRKVDVRRAWPDRLEVNIEEHVALARWGEDRMVNVQGEVFAAVADDLQNGDLPRLYGPGASERQVTEHYLAFKSILAPLQLEPRQVLLSTRYAWRLRLYGRADKSGLTVELGRDTGPDTVTARLERFAAVYAQTLGQLNRRFDYVDLRYPNGFALRAPGMFNSETDSKSARKNT